MQAVEESSGGVVRMGPATLYDTLECLVADRGTAAAWARTGLDLTVTVPHYQLERIMTAPHTNRALNASVVLLLVLGGVASLTVDNGIGPVLVILGLALGLSRRSPLATSFRVPDPSLRRKRLRTAAVLGLVFVASYATFVLTVGDSWSITDTLLALIGVPAMSGAPLFLIAGLLTRHTPDIGDAAADGPWRK